MQMVHRCQMVACASAETAQMPAAPPQWRFVARLSVQLRHIGAYADSGMSFWPQSKLGKPR